ncbi:hypothetical protein FLA4_08050 [Candidatus Rickettsia kotlanii]|nr:hypothetical protein FLA4_08050 [Candidatus Rickettsia kotlanii]BDU61638.1 hypothetical protein HM2_08060 [Candidatus Rickettsia kotlanii]
MSKSYEIIHIDLSKNQIKLSDSMLKVYCSQVLKKLSIAVFLKKKLLAEIKIIEYI